jgi:hypothetical protein
VLAVVVALAGVGVFALAGSGGALVVAKQDSALVQSRHVAFEGCPPATTVVKASLKRLTYTPYQAVTITVSVTNGSGTACGRLSGQGLIPGQGQLSIGPCGTFGLEVQNAKGTNIYPGTAAFACPAEFGVAVPAHGAVKATTSWNQEASYASKALAGRGKYRLSIVVQMGAPTKGGMISFPITLTGSSAGSLPAGPLPPESAGPVTVCPEPAGGSAPLLSCAGATPAVPKGRAVAGPPCQATSATLISAACPMPVVTAQPLRIPTTPPSG